MLTSIAAQPAYLGSIAQRTKAKPDRTIFGTTLDNYQKCRLLLSNQKALREAEIFCNKKRQEKWQRRVQHEEQGAVEKAWGSRIQAPIEREFGLHQGSTATKPQTFAAEGAWTECHYLKPDKSSEPFANSASPKQEAYLSFARNRTLRTQSALIDRSLPRSPPSRLLSAQPNVVSKTFAMSSAKPAAKQSKIQVPKFRIPPDATNVFRTASLKITETGAKDLINAREVNKVGLGNTLQYNHEAFKQREYPEFYKSHGDVRLLGQRFRDETTNSDISAPGGYLRLPTPDREINKRNICTPPKTYWTPPKKIDTNEDVRKKTTGSEMSNQSELTEDDIPLNIRHKFGKETVLMLIRENNREVKRALRCPSDLRHSGIVPARKEVKELNHPVDPPPAFFQNFGKNLKSKETEGGLHMYIK